MPNHFGRTSRSQGRNISRRLEDEAIRKRRVLLSEQMRFQDKTGEFPDVSFAEQDRKSAAKTSKAKEPAKTKAGGTDAQKKAAIGQLTAKGIGEATGGSRAGNQSTAAGVATGAASGAALGFSVGGAYGAAVGGVVGGAVGALKASSSRSQAAREAQAKKEEALAGISLQKGQRINQALTNMSIAFGSTFRQNEFLGRF